MLRELGRKLHRQLPSSGNWETLAEDLGYGFEDIHQFASLANVRQEITPGESMLLNWVQRSHGCTLFVLRSALVKADRQDCVEYLEREIYGKHAPVYTFWISYRSVTEKSCMVLKHLSHV